MKLGILKEKIRQYQSSGVKYYLPIFPFSQEAEQITHLLNFLTQLETCSSLYDADSEVSLDDFRKYLQNNNMSLTDSYINGPQKSAEVFRAWRDNDSKPAVAAKNLKFPRTIPYGYISEIDTPPEVFLNNNSTTSSPEEPLQEPCNSNLTNLGTGIKS